MHTDGNGAEQRNAKPADLSPGKEVPLPHFQTGSKGFFSRPLCPLRSFAAKPTAACRDKPPSAVQTPLPRCGKPVWSGGRHCPGGEPASTRRNVTPLRARPPLRQRNALSPRSNRPSVEKTSVPPASNRPSAKKTPDPPPSNRHSVKKMPIPPRRIGILSKKRASPARRIAIFPGKR